MSLFQDILGGGYQSGADALKAGYTSGYGQATPLYQQGRDVVQQDYTQALQPWMNVSTTGNQGVDQLKAALGIGGNSASVLNTLQNTPGYQFTLQQALQGVDRGAAARGLGTSGNAITAEQDRAAQLAQQTYQNYVQSLMPFLQAQQAGAAGQSGVLTGLGSTLGSSYSNQGNLGYNTQVGQGAADLAGKTATQNATNSFLSGIANLGGKLLGAQGNSFNISGGGGGGGTTPSGMGGSYNPSQFTQSGLYLG